jgi:hypothetical protein
MRNRTELVTNTGSDYDEEQEFDADDGSDDWKPDPEVSRINFFPYFQFRENCFHCECISINGGISKLHITMNTCCIIMLFA